MYLYSPCLLTMYAQRTLKCTLDAIRSWVKSATWGSSGLGVQARGWTPKWYNCCTVSIRRASLRDSDLPLTPKPDSGPISMMDVCRTPVLCSESVTLQNACEPSTLPNEHCTNSYTLSRYILVNIKPNRFLRSSLVSGSRLTPVGSHAHPICALGIPLPSWIDDVREWPKFVRWVGIAKRSDKGTGCQTGRYQFLYYGGAFRGGTKEKENEHLRVGKKRIEGLKSV